MSPLFLHVLSSSSCSLTSILFFPLFFTPFSSHVLFQLLAPSSCFLPLLSCPLNHCTCHFPLLLFFLLLSCFILSSHFINSPCSSPYNLCLFPVLTCPCLSPLPYLPSSTFLLSSFLLCSPSFSPFPCSILFYPLKKIFFITPFSSFLLLFLLFPNISLFFLSSPLLRPGYAPRTDGGGASGARSVALTAVTLAGANADGLT